MTNWNHDISAAPRGKMVPYTRKGKDGPVQSEQYRKEYILAVDVHGDVYQSYWIPPRFTQSGGLLEGNRWSGFNPGVDPIAWAPWPEYPNNSKSDAAISRPGIATLGRPEDENRSAEEAPEADASGGVQDRVRVHPATHFILEDVGGGA